MNPTLEKLAVRNLRFNLTVDEAELLIQLLEPLASEQKDIELLLHEVYAQLERQGVQIAKED